jgi:heat shock protein HspQ
MRYNGRTMGKGALQAMRSRSAKFGIGQVVKHRFYPFRGVIFDVDPVFANTDEWWRSIPAEVRPAKEQPFYHLYAENADSQYVAYVSEQNLMSDESGEPVRHPQVSEVFERTEDGRYCARDRARLS